MLRYTTATMLIVAALLNNNIAVAQTNKDTDTKEQSFFKIDLNYINNTIYLGRADSLVLPYLTPTIGYYDKRGFYASASVGYLSSAATKRIDYYSFDIGYEFDISEKMSGSLAANKCIYQEGSKVVSSDVKGSLSANLAYDFNWFELNTGLSASFANKTDIGIDATIAHSFYMGNEDKQWTITPKATINFSTLYFYEGYTSRSFSSRQLFYNPAILSVSSITKAAQNKLTLMDIELYVPVNYDEKKWGIYCTPTLAIPRNPIYTSTTSTIKFRNGNSSVKTEDSTPGSEKNLLTRFFIEAGIYFKL